VHARSIHDPLHNHCTTGSLFFSGNERPKSSGAKVLSYSEPVAAVANDLWTARSRIDSDHGDRRRATEGTATATGVERLAKPCAGCYFHRDSRDCRLPPGAAKKKAWAASQGHS
jgi:hypothetical protein